MKNHTFTSSIPLNEDYDVIVVGGGPTGCTAAAAAAREGAKTLLLEGSGMLGGSGTSALVPAWCPFSDKEQIIYRGLAEKVLNECKKHQLHVGVNDVDWVPIDAELLKRVYDSLVTESGADVLFHTVLSAVEMGEDGGVQQIIVSNKNGLTAYRAKVFVDCSGDGDLTAWAGAEFHQGDDDGNVMPATHCFVLTNVDEYAFRYKYVNGVAFHPGHPNSPMFNIIESGKYPLIADGHCCASLIGPKTVGFNTGHMWNVDNTNPHSVSQALVHGRKMAKQYRDAFAEMAPDCFGNAFLVMTGSQVGIRETRRIVGDYVLTLADYLARRSFADEICRNSYFIDIHQAQADVAKNNANRAEGLDNPVRYGAGESHGIPYRCLLPKGIRNVLVAGRSISCERVVQGSVRVMPVCLAMGEAAGMAAAHALQGHDGDVHAVDTNRLRDRLREEGGYLPEFHDEAAELNGHRELATAN